MSKVEEKLKHFEDFELAFIFKYKADNYLENTKQKILKELFNRGIRREEVETLVEQKLSFEIQNHNFKICPRCTSEKIINTREMYYSELEQYDYLVGEEPKYTTKYLCGVCGWDFQEDMTRTERKKYINSIIIFLIVIIIWQIFKNIPFIIDKFFSSK